MDSLVSGYLNGALTASPMLFTDCIPVFSSLSNCSCYFAPFWELPIHLDFGDEEVQTVLLLGCHRIGSLVVVVVVVVVVLCGVKFEDIPCEVLRY